MYPIEIGSNISKIKDTFHMQKNKLFKYDLSIKVFIDVLSHNT